MRQMQDTKQDKRNPTLPTNLLSSFGWAYRYQVFNFVAFCDIFDQPGLLDEVGCLHSFSGAACQLSDQVGC